MKFRTAKKIVHHNDKYRGSYLFTPPWYKKAVEVYIRHRKRNHRQFFVSRGIIDEKGNILL